MLELDTNLHAPARLRMMTLMTAVSEAEFSTVATASRSATRCSPNTWAHSSRSAT